MFSALFNFRYQNMPTHRGYVHKEMHVLLFFFCLVEIGFCDVSLLPHMPLHGWHIS